MSRESHAARASIPLASRLRQAGTALRKLLPYGWRTIRAPDLSPRARAQFLTAGLRWLVAPRRDSWIDLDAGSIVIRGHSARFDATVFYEILVTGCYDTEYRGRVVVDAGAHRGYYGAFALLKGARAVYSFEPERDNYGSLELAAASFRASGHVWHCERSAVTSRNGTVELFVNQESWAHSIYPDVRGQAVGREGVPARSFTSIVDAARSATDGAPLVVKLDIEGAECDVILRTPIREWLKVYEVFFEFHPEADCALESLLSHLRLAGLSVVESDPMTGVYHLIRRSLPKLER